MQERKFPIGLVVVVVVGALIGGGLAMLVLGTNTAANRAGGLVIATSSRALLREGQPAPVWTLNTLDGKPIALSEMNGQPALINFWASWCPPCIEETPALIEAYNELKGEGRAVEFIGIGTNDEVSNLQKFAANNDVSYVLVADPDGKVSDAYGVLGMPTTVFVDSNGIVRKIHNGAITKAQVLDIMRGLK
jgi:peroxiredoxin